MGMKSIAFVSPRLPVGGAIGGAETLLMHVARLARGAGLDVTFLTTCAKSHVSWENDVPAGEVDVDGLRAIRFPVDPRGNLDEFLRVQESISAGWPVSDEQEDAWMRGGVNSSAMEAHLRGADGARYDRVVAGPYLFGLIDMASRAAEGRFVLLPCLHDEPFARIRRVAKIFSSARSFIFNTEPERLLAHRLFPNVFKDKSRGTVVGFPMPEPTGEEPSLPSPAADIGPYILYSGRREPLKGTPLLLDYWAAFRRLTGRDVKLVLTGSGPVDVPTGMAGHLIDLGFVSEGEKRALMSHALAFCHPSVNESLSIVLLEAWQGGTPCVVHAAGNVLRHQCRAANGGLWFRDYPEFAECIEFLMDNPDAASRLGENGREFVRREYSPEAVTRRLLAALEI